MVQVFLKLLEFDGVTNAKYPVGSLLIVGTSLYGMTSDGGLNNFGTLYKILNDGTGFSKLIDFDDLVSGKYPIGSLIYDSPFLYGTTSAGGTNNKGTVFKYEHSPNNINDYISTNNYAAIYPNPTKNLLTINSNEQIQTINIIDVTGKTIQSLVNPNNTINVSELNKGIYFLAVKTKNGITYNRFIKE